MKKLNSLGTSTKEAVEALRNFGNAFKSGYATGGIVPENRTIALNNAMKENDMEEYARIKGISKDIDEIYEARAEMNELYQMTGTIFFSFWKWIQKSKMHD